jgi:hypothetical protein
LEDDHDVFLDDPHQHNAGLELDAHAADYDLLPAIDLETGDAVDSPVVHLEPLDIADALREAELREGFDPGSDVPSAGWISNLQGVSAEYLVADALNHSGDGLTYHLYADPSHPDVDLAGVSADGSLVRLIQVKATPDSSYAETGHHPGVEVMVTRDGWASDMVPMDMTAADLRREIRDLLGA